MITEMHNLSLVLLYLKAMPDEEKLGVLASFMQSFTSIGPMLDTVAIFSVIAIFSGISLPLVMLLAFIVGYSTIYTTYRLSGRFVTNGGYYSYAGKILGKDAGIFVGLLYLAYALLVLPNIALFFGSFFVAVFSPYANISAIGELAASLLFTSMVILVVSRGLKLTFRYTIIAGILELLVLGVSTALFFSRPAEGFTMFSSYHVKSGSVWLGLIFGVVVFAGSGSSIFFSDNTKKPSSNVPKSIFSAYTVSGIIMILASLSLVLFLGPDGLASYSSNPFIILGYIQGKFGTTFYAIFVAFAMISALNLSIAFINALKSGFSRMRNENLFGSVVKKRAKDIHLLAFVLILSFTIETIAYATGSFFYTFAAMAGAVGLLYISVHVITNFAVLRIHRVFKGYSAIILPLVSSGVLIVSFYYSAIDQNYSLVLTNVIFCAVLVVAIASTLYIRTKPAHYNSISITAVETRTENLDNPGETA